MLRRSFLSLMSFSGLSAFAGRLHIGIKPNVNNPDNLPVIEFNEQGHITNYKQLKSLAFVPDSYELYMWCHKLAPTMFLPVFDRSQFNPNWIHQRLTVAWSNTWHSHMGAHGEAFRGEVILSFHVSPRNPHDLPKDYCNIVQTVNSEVVTVTNTVKVCIEKLHA